MKRSPLRTGLTRKALRRTGKPLRRTRTPRVAPGEAAQALRFREITLTRARGRSELSGQPAQHAHHALDQTLLKRMGRRDLLWDPEGGMALSAQEHASHHAYAPRIRPEQLPERVWKWARRHDLERALERLYPVSGTRGAMRRSDT